MKITGTRSYMIVEFTDGNFYGKKIKIEGELTLTPTFYAVKESIKLWKNPHEKEIITEEEKKQILEQILEYNNPTFKISFED